MSLSDLRQKHQKELKLFELKEEYNTVFEYQDMLILSIIYGIVETKAVENLYQIITLMMKERKGMPRF